MKRLFLSIALLSVASLSAKTNLPQDEHAVIRSDRADGRYVATRGVVQDMLRRTRESLAFDASMPDANFAEWRSSVRTELRKLLAFPSLPAAPAPRLLGREKRDGYTLEKWEHYPMPNVAVPYLALVPDGVSSGRPAPIVLCLPGTSMTKESSAGEPELNPASAIYKEYVRENRMALEYCRNGFVAIAVDNPGVGETADMERVVGGHGRHIREITAFGHFLFNLGWSYMGYASYVNHRLLEVLRNDPRVDPSRMALSGHSLGGWMVAFLTVLNEDIAAAVVNQQVYRWHEAATTVTRPNAEGNRPELLGHGVFYFIPGLYRYMDMPDVCAAIAPRPLLLSEGVPERDRREVFLPAWKKAGHPERLSIVPFERYKEPSSRYVGDPPEGLGSIRELYGYYSNDYTNHYFKGQVAVPWLKRAMERRADDAWETRREALKSRPRQLILNSDGNEVIYWPTNLPVSAENFTAQRLDTYRESRVSTVAYCPQSSGFGLMTTTRAGEFFGIPRCIPELKPDCLNAAPLLKAKGLDCLDLTADYCHTNGMEVFVSIRVNDTHDASYFIPGTNPPRSYLFPKWKDANRDCLFGTCSNRPPLCAWTAVDFENPKTRAYMKKFVGEFVENYDVDGIEYDFFRHGQLFKSVGWGAYATEAQLTLMTDFMLELRAITEAAGRKKGRPILVLVRTSDSLGYAKAQGIDVETWLRRGVMDIWSVSDYFQLAYLRPNAELAHKYGVKFNSALAESRVPGAFALQQKKNRHLAKAIMLPGRNTIGSYAAEYAAAMAAGCDGISSFNLSCVGGINRRGLLDIDPRKTQDLDKIYFALVRGSGGYPPESWVKDGGKFYVRPRIDPARPFKIPTGRPYSFGIEFGDEEWPRFDAVAKAALADGRQVVTELKVNGRTIAPGAFKDGVQAFPLKPGDLTKGYNEFAVTVNPKFGKEVVFHDFAVYLNKAKLSR